MNVVGVECIAVVAGVSECVQYVLRARLLFLQCSGGELLMSEW